MNTPPLPEIQIRLAEPGDQGAITALLRASLGKQKDPHYESFLHWKHQENPFGESPAWVAVHEQQIVGFRTFLRWQFIDEEDRVLRAVRAVDTATDPDFRGRGVFKSLTLQAIADLTLERQHFVFNTPNDQSRPGYLSMGWNTVGRVPVGVQLSGPHSLATMRHARVPAQLWGDPTVAGINAAEFFADPRNAEAVLVHAQPSGVRTNRTAEYLSWRTKFAPLGYRVLPISESDAAEGALVFRVRRRGPAIEVAIVEFFVPDVASSVHLVRRVLAESGADYAIGVHHGLTGGLAPLPRQGPLLATRALSAAPPGRRSWHLSLADVELF